MEYSDSLVADMRTLEDKHILYHLGDEILIRRHGRVENGKFIIGNMSYSTLVIPKNLGFLPYTEELIAEFRKQGGVITTAEEISANPVTSVNRLSYTKRVFDGFTLHYFVNSDDTALTADFTVGSKRLVAETGETVPFGGSYTFAPYESILLIDDGTPAVECEQTACEELSLVGEWRVKSFTENSLTLDRCDYYFDGELVEKDGYVLNILPRINELERAVKLRQEYRFVCDYVAEDTCLVTETPDMFEIEINGTRVEKIDLGYFRDSSFRRLPVAKYLKRGENVITFNSTVVQSDATYEHISKSWAFESMKNCLSYDCEIEPIYITGSFGVQLPTERTELDKGAYRIYSLPTVVAPPATVMAEALDEGGFAEFSGTLVLEKEIDASDTALYCKLVGRGMNALTLAVNGETVATKMFAPFDVDLSTYLKQGKNTLTLTIVNNLRNMMGPHHLKEGESYHVSPGSFYKESNIFNHRPGALANCHDTLPTWDDGFCLVHFGIGE